MQPGLNSAYARRTPEPGRLNDLSLASTPASMARPTPAARVRMAYLVSRYPAVSHTFILREVRELRSRGFDIEVASINRPDRDVAAMTADEREESAKTYYVKQHGLLGALSTHVAALLSPVRYLRGLGYALSLGGLNLSRIVFGLFYFTEPPRESRRLSCLSQATMADSAC